MHKKKYEGGFINTRRLEFIHPHELDRGRLKTKNTLYDDHYNVLNIKYLRIIVRFKLLL